MSISILNRGGISAGLKPELTVTAPSGSTIDIIQNSIIVATHTLGADETGHTFVVKVGTYTVKGTLGTKVQSKEVIIEVVGQYSVEIDYKLWLYREGDECEDVTGGWSADGYAFYPGYSNYAGVKNANGMYFELRSSGASWTNLGTNNAVNLSGYSKIYMEYQNTTMYLSRAVQLYICSNKGDVVNTLVGSIEEASGTLNRTTLFSNITLNGNYYIDVGASNGRAGYCFNVWLE